MMFEHITVGNNFIYNPDFDSPFNFAVCYGILYQSDNVFYSMLIQGLLEHISHIPDLERKQTKSVTPSGSQRGYLIQFHNR